MKLRGFLLFLPLVCTLSAGEIPTDVSAQWRLGAPEAREQSLRVNDYSPEIGKVLEIRMVPSVFSYVELRYGKPFSVAVGAEELEKLAFSLELLAKPAVTVTAVSVRLIDATGEIFQYRTTPFQLQAGNWSKITIPSGLFLLPWRESVTGISDFFQFLSESAAMAKPAAPTALQYKIFTKCFIPLLYSEKNVLP